MLLRWGVSGTHWLTMAESRHIHQSNGVKTTVENSQRGGDSRKSPLHNSQRGGDGQKTSLDNIIRGGETLKRIHAQSSAETSGLGDSLQRIHALSSTETSGYWDGGESPEYQENTCDVRLKKSSPDLTLIAGGAVASHRNREYYRAHSLEGNKNNRVITRQPSVAAGSSRTTGGNQLHIDCDRLTQVSTSSQHGSGGGMPVEQRRSLLDHDDDKITNNQMSIDAEIRNIVNGGAGGSSRGRTHGNYNNHNDNIKVPGVAQRIKVGERSTGRGQQLGKDTGIKKSASQTSITSNKSTGEGGYFLGRGTKSTWMTWSQDRRASFKRRMKSMEERQKELEENRVSTPVLKARKESVMFVRAGEDQVTLPSEQDLHIHERLQSYVPSKARRHHIDDKDELKLSTYQWSALVTFWEHPMFIKCRWGGIFLASCALVLTIICLTNQQWSIYPGQ